MASDHDKYALEYDRQTERYNCYIAEALFGLCYEEINIGERLLDVGIGTGISSKLFKKAGLQILGIDGSRAMLSICQEKKIALELIEQDILDIPWPYQDASINHIISCGVFHFIGDLEKIFAEIQRIQIVNGLFAFTVKISGGKEAGRQKYYRRIEDGIYIFEHKIEYITKLLSDFHYIKTKEITCFVGDTPFRVIGARKSD